jgi:tetrahydromethanopterin:alpha-L-glutamate ligase
VLTEKQKEIAEKAATAIGTTNAGVDIIERLAEHSYKKNNGNVSQKEENFQVLEVNGTPSGKGIFDAWGINPAEYIIGYIENIL